MINEKRKSDSMLAVNIYMAIVLIMLSPALYSISMLRMAMLGLMLLWLAINIINNRFYLPWTTVFIVTYIVLSVAKYYIDTDLIFNPRITRIYYYCFFAVSFSFIEKSGIDKYKRVIWAVLSVMPVWLVISIYYGLSIEDLFRNMSGSGLADAESYARLGVVGYDYIYGIVICIPLFLGLLFSTKKLKTWQVVLVIINTVLNVALLWIANYGLAFFSLILGVVLFLVYGMSNRYWRTFFALLIIVLTVIAILNFQTVLKALINLLSGSYYSGKLKKLYDSLNDGTSYGRIDIWKNAISKFFDNPIWGKGFNIPGGVNTHSEILYALVYYGIIVGGFEIAIMFSVFWGCDLHSNIAYRVNMATIAVFSVVLFFDPAGIAFGPLMYTLFKLSQSYFSDEPDVIGIKEGVIAT